ncbi:MAG: hypothetical protein IJ187_09045 [Neisseriaceae bacterium]|nr:hypothetical protein [Neisseriaceae bacterium]MBQ9724805.1 hypothetical protein [Neisseriaceae bacterium]
MGVIEIIVWIIFIGIFVITGAAGFAVALFLSFIFRVKEKNRALFIFFIVSLFIAADLYYLFYHIHRDERKRHKEIEAARTAAEPIFAEQCKKSGEQIYRTVENVDGVRLLKIWRGANADNDKPLYNDPQWEYAAWDVAGGKSYIGYFLNNPKNSMGYSFVDVRLDDNQIERYLGEYHGSLDGNLPDIVDTELNPIEPVQYAITFENNTDPALRKHWIAGTTFKIMDLQTNELLAEKTIFINASGIEYWSRNSVSHCGVDGRYDGELKNDVLQFINSVLKPREQKY